ncbi:TonB-linked outer membrane protein, SusC/RagA family [Saccharicrinis carchari]|uniref:TonB-linked outer membrane protein, SusC/RagA family n=1 Tax=Saccharicrinis carchari TaxID=1168039 RepID=A0A521B0Q4_SACCC|nr:TonB-dependent receptor [Saccharicrinis carchari]SMO40662.1 TonB-linked outer membrane protein, SusC/RagA family [Saccharicrinis carchari]
MKQKLVKQNFRILFTLLFFLTTVVISAQVQKTVKGTVLDETGTPLPGASVVVKGTLNGTSTNLDGKFSLNVKSDATTLRVSFIGYQNLEVAITDNIRVSLQPDTDVLEEVVVVGYGTQKKSDLVSAVAKADLGKATVTPTSDVNEMLRGRISGLKVDVGGGTLRPGGSSEILFRGRGSIEGNVSGIYVVDGVVRDGGIEDINPDDIESVEFLKDASAQAIYGSRAVNGVVLITTKRGKKDKVSVSYHGYITTKSIEKNFDVYSGQEFAQLKREAVRATNADDSYSDDVDVFSVGELENIANNKFVDWEDELMRNGTVHSQSISVAGGTERTKIYGSLNYFREDGIIPTSSYTRKNLRLNVDQEINDKFSVAFDVNLLNDDTERAANVNVITVSPLGSAYHEDGSITRYPSGEELSATSPLWNLRESDNDTKGNDFVINVLPKWQITKDLTYQFKGSMTRKNSERGQYQSSLSSAGNTDKGIARIDNQLREAFLVENILTYNKRFDENNLFNLTLVQAVDENKYTKTFTEGRGFINESLGYDGITNAIGNVTVERYKTKIRTASYMGRARYNLMDKYLLTATLRGDGSSVNSEDNKWTYNPAAAFAWKLHNEPFLQYVDAVRELKLRVSYGALANALKLPYTSLFTADGQNYMFDGESASGYSPSVVLPNVNLKHETITTLNIGLDFAAFGNLLAGNIEYYDSRTKDLLLRRGVPSITGYKYTYFNAGELQNKGIELNLTANIINTHKFKWSVSTNWSNNKNKLIDLYNDGSGNAILEDDAYNYYVGQPIGVIRQYQFDGIWQEGEDFANAPQANPESTITQADLRPGDIKIKDTNKDGMITQDDRVFIDPNPDWFGSFSTNLSYLGFDLFVDFYVVEGATKVNPFLSAYNNGGTLQGKLNGVKVPYYTPENPSTTFPRPNFDSAPQYLNSLAIKDASYIRLRTLSLGYTLPKSILNRVNIDMVKFYVTGTNLFTSTDYIGYSPEVNIRSTYSNADTGYPDARSFTFGVKVNL